MHLAQPAWLWFFAVMPFLAWRVASGRARRARDWSALGQGGRPARDGAYLWLAAVGCLTLALAEPRWGRSSRPPLPPGHDVVFAIDVSRSMAATDAVPDRLGVAVGSAASLVKALGREPGDRVAVVAFAGRGVLRCPLTENLGAVTETLRALRPGDVRPGGTDLGSALDAALDAFDDQDRAGGRFVVLFSDGEDHESRWKPAAERLLAQGVLVHTVAVGDDEQGHPVPDASSEPIRYQGSVVLSKRSDKSLESIAHKTGGAFVPLGLATTDLGRLYQTRIDPVARSKRRAIFTPEPAERFALFLVAALALGLVASWPSRTRPVLRRRRWFAALAASATLGAGPHDDPAQIVAQGNAAYLAGHHADALADFRRASNLAPTSPVPRYDAAAALYQLGQYAEAQSLYLEARELAPARLRTKIDFALGNTALRLGDLDAAIRHYNDCLVSTAQGPDLDAVRLDAAVNRTFAEEQAKHSPAPPDDRDGGESKRPPGNTPAPSPDGQGGGAQNSSEGSGGETPKGRRGAGGAGGEGIAPPVPGSPEDQLSKAVDNVRESRRLRITEVPGSDDQDNRKDW